METTTSDRTADRIDRALDESTKAAKSTANDLKDGVAEITDAARETAERTAAQVSERVERASDTLRDAAASLRDGSLGDRTFGQLAAGLADVSDSIRDKNFAELSRDAQRFARANPLLFAGGAALLGFAIARMMTEGDDA